MTGTWKLSLAGTLPHWPEDQRKDMMITWLAFRPEPPTDQELEAIEVGADERLGIFIMRQKQIEEPDDRRVASAREALETLKTISVVHDENGLTLVTPGERQAHTYTVVSDEGDVLVVDTTDPEGETDRLEVTFDGEDRISVRELGEDDDGGPETMVFLREGSEADRAETLGALPETAPEGVAVPQGLIGQWGEDGRRDSVEFFAEHRYVLHGLGGDIEGEYRVLEASGSSMTVRTRIAEFPWVMGDTIEIELSGADELSWHNTGTDARTQYVRRTGG